MRLGSLFLSIAALACSSFLSASAQDDVPHPWYAQDQDHATRDTHVSKAEARTLVDVVQSTTATRTRSCDDGASETITYNHTQIYVAGPRTAKAGILAFPDIFGMDSGRSKADADAIGQLGYAVAYVDLTDGDYMTPENQNDRFAKWLPKYDFDVFAYAKVQDAIRYLQEEAKVEVIASYGYCWGAYIGARLSAVDNTVIAGHVSFHPSWNVENMLRGDGAVEKLTEKVQVPQVLLSSQNEPDYLREGGSVEQILKANPNISELSEVVDFPDMAHGWVHRGNLSDPAVKAAVEKAWNLARTLLQTVNPV